MKYGGSRDVEVEGVGNAAVENSSHCPEEFKA